jgi:hypothetical protein
MRRRSSTKEWWKSGECGSSYDSCSLIMYSDEEEITGVSTLVCHCRCPDKDEISTYVRRTLKSISLASGRHTTVIVVGVFAHREHRLLCSNAIRCRCGFLAEHFLDGLFHISGTHHISCRHRLYFGNKDTLRHPDLED